MNRKELYILSATVFFSVIAWFIADLYHVATTNKIKISNDLKSTAVRIHIDENLIKLLETRN